jgi:exodeoxyribonuclease V beta subunit
MTARTPLDIATLPLEGTTLIEASAGTGKTFAIAQIYVRLILEKKLGVDNILVVTFTEAAAGELRERIRANLIEAHGAAGDHAACRNQTLGALLEQAVAGGSTPVEVKGLVRKALVSFDEAAIGTIHGFCNRVLIDNSFESGLLFDTELIADQQDLLQEITDDFWRRTFCDGEPLTGAVAANNRLGTSSLLHLAGEVVRKPFVKILPEPQPQDRNRLPALLEDLRREWRASAAQISSLLRDSPSLKRSGDTYRPDVLDQLLHHLDQGFSGTPTPDTLSAINRCAARTLAGNVKKNGAPPDHRFFELCDEFSRAEASAVVQVQHDFAAYLRTELHRRKKERNIQSFDTLLLDLAAALTSEGGPALARTIRAGCKAVLIDEFQDTDPVQYQIFDTLFNHPDGCLFLIGDPKQSIYDFRGADVFSYLAAASKTKKNRQYTLTTNWRSESGFVEALNLFFGKRPNPFVLGDALSYVTVTAAPESIGNTHPLSVDGDASPGVRFWMLQSTEHTGTPKKFLSKNAAAAAAVTAVVGEISRILDLATQGKACIGKRVVRPSDIAVLVLRNDDAARFVEPLSSRGIPVVLAKAGSIYHTPDADDVERLLRAAASPGNARRLNAALATAPIGYDAGQICRLVEDPDRQPDYERHLELFSSYAAMWSAHGFMRMFRKLLADYQVRQTLLRRPDGERRLTNLLHLAELLHRASLEGRLGISGLLAYLTRQKTRSAETDEHELRLERDDEAVQILTVFKSKGLQYPIVFCPFMWQKGAQAAATPVAFHRDAATFLDLGSPERESVNRPLAERQRLSELMRLLYVGLTRAQSRCYLAGGRIGRACATALDYLFAGCSEESPAEVAATIDRVQALSEDTYLDAVRAYFSRASESLRLESPPRTRPAPGTPASGAVSGLSCRAFSGRNRINRDWGIASFSLLAALHPAAPPGPADAALKQDERYSAQAEDAVRPEGFFAFPRGAVAGSCIHSIFEHLDFCSFDSPAAITLIGKTLKNYACDDAPDRTAAVRDMIARVLTSPLVPGDSSFTLQTVSARDRIAELGFHYPLASISPTALEGIFARHTGGSAGIGPGLPQKIGGLQFRPLEGFMQGFIDLVVHRAGKYYLLDWKTNHLGNRYDDYAPDRLQTVMQESLYTLQYVIYAVALHLYLEQRVPGYRYAQHFGGVVYLFVRGITPERPGCGMFFDLPAQALIEDMRALCPPPFDAAHTT